MYKCINSYIRICISKYIYTHHMPRRRCVNRGIETGVVAWCGCNLHVICGCILLHHMFRPRSVAAIATAIYFVKRCVR